MVLFDAPYRFTRPLLSGCPFSIETVLPKFPAAVQSISLHKRYSSMLPAYTRTLLLASEVFSRFPWNQLSRLSLMRKRILLDLRPFQVRGGRPSIRSCRGVGDPKDSADGISSSLINGDDIPCAYRYGSVPCREYRAKTSYSLRVPRVSTCVGSVRTSLGLLLRGDVGLCRT